MKVLWNEEIVDRQEVQIDIEDRGYQYGDGIYEVIRIYQGKMFMAEEHLQRLENSAAKIKMTLPYETTILKDRLRSLIDIEGITDGEVYLQVTRGVLSPRNHVFPPQGTIKSVLTANVIPFHRPVDMQRNGLQATLISDQRWLHCDIKSLSLLGNLLSLEEARSNGYDEALLHREGFFYGSLRFKFMVCFQRNGVYASGWQSGFTWDHKNESFKLVSGIEATS